MNNIEAKRALVRANIAREKRQAKSSKSSKKRGSKLGWLLLMGALLTAGYLTFRWHGEGYWYNAHNTLIMKICNLDHVIHKNEFHRIPIVGDRGDVMSVSGTLLVASKLDNKGYLELRTAIAKEWPSMNTFDLDRITKNGHIVMVLKVDLSNSVAHAVTFILSQEEYDEFKGQDYKMGDIVTLKTEYVGTMKNKTKSGEASTGFNHVFSGGVKILNK